MSVVRALGTGRGARRRLGSPKRSPRRAEGRPGPGVCLTTFPPRCLTAAATVATEARADSRPASNARRPRAAAARRARDPARPDRTGRSAATAARDGDAVRHARGRPAAVPAVVVDARAAVRIEEVAAPPRGELASRSALRIRRAAAGLDVVRRAAQLVERAPPRPRRELARSPARARARRRRRRRRRAPPPRPRARAARGLLLPRRLPRPAARRRRSSRPRRRTRRPGRRSARSARERGNVPARRGGGGKRSARVLPPRRAWSPKRARGALRRPRRRRIRGRAAAACLDVRVDVALRVEARGARAVRLARVGLGVERARRPAPARRRRRPPRPRPRRSAWPPRRATGTSGCASRAGARAGCFRPAWRARAPRFPRAEDNRLWVRASESE